MNEIEHREIPISSSETTVKEVCCNGVRLLNITLDNVGSNALSGLKLYTRPTENAPYTPLAEDDDFGIASMFILFASTNIHALESGMPGTLILNVESFESVKLASTSSSGTELDFFGVLHA